MSANFSVLFLILILTLLTRKNASGVTKTCQTTIAVNSEFDGDSCDDSNLMCGDLTMALELVNNSSELNASDCFKITIAPGGYSITKFLSIHKNLVLHGLDSESPVLVTFAVKSDFHSILFSDVLFVEISGVQFQHSPGIVGFEFVDKVVIKNSAFRLEN